MISVGVFSIVFVGALMVVRNSILGPDLGLHWALVALAAALLVASIAIAARRKKYLTRRILAGLPELEADGGGGTLLSEGIYARIRHPRYVEVALGTLAYAAFANYAGAWIVALATVPVLHLIVLLEERELVERFVKSTSDTGSGCRATYRGSGAKRESTPTTSEGASGPAAPHHAQDLRGNQARIVAEGMGATMAGGYVTCQGDALEDRLVQLSSGFVEEAIVPAGPVVMG